MSDVLFPHAILRALVLSAMTLAASVAAPECGAAIPWHSDLAQAKLASQVSRRPVLILFVASWSEASVKHETTFLGSEESIALLTACFEPVKIDVDADKTTPRRLDVHHVPCACVIDPEERVLARFDCPESSAAFVAAAGRAAQDAAVACAGPLPAPPAAPPPAAEAVSSAAASPAPPPAASEAPGAAIAATPPAWPAEPASAPIGTAPPPAPSGTIEPATSAAPQTTTPPPAAEGQIWLTPQAAPQAAAPPPPALPPPPPAAATPEPAKKSGFWATVQKPFGSLMGKPAKQEESSPPPELPSTGVPGGETSASMPVGLEGYCAVTLVEKGTWVEGRARWGVRHRGRTYLCAGPEEQRAFLANPDRYSPGLSGDDPVLAFDSGKKVAGQRQYGVSYRSKIYLFSSPDTQAAFKVDPQKYAQRVQLAEQTSEGQTLR